MKESSTYFPIENISAYCDSDGDSPLVTLNIQVVFVIFGIFIVIAIITVFANCTITVAIIRAYLYGISASVQSSRRAIGGSSQGKQRIRLGNDSSNISIVLMVSMAVTDALLGAVIIPLYTIEIFTNGQWPLGNLSCKFRMYLDIVLSVSSIYHVTCMAGDRYLAICRLAAIPSSETVSSDRRCVRGTMLGCVCCDHFAVSRPCRSPHQGYRSNQP